MPKKKIQYISDAMRLKVLCSPIRQEIVDYIDANGPSSIATLSKQLRHSPTALYYHVKMLVKANLLNSIGSKKGKRRSEEVFDVNGSLRQKYLPNDRSNVEACKKLTAAMLRVATKDFDEGLKPNLAVTEGRFRNIRAFRVQAWLTKSELEQVNRHLEAVVEIFKNGQRDRQKQLCSLTTVIAPKSPEKEKK